VVNFNKLHLKFELILTCTKAAMDNIIELSRLAITVEGDN